MGTRHLICVYWQGGWYLAQYGQWDGYPSGQGADIVEFLSNPKNIKDLKFGLEHCVYRATDKDLDAYSASNPPPSLSRDTSAKILSIIATAGAAASEKQVDSGDKEDVAGKIPLVFQLEFVLDTLFCEWAYVIDLDTECLEVYCGPDQKKTDNHRFKSIGGPDDPVPTLAASFNFEVLRTMTREEFAELCEGKEVKRFESLVTYTESGDMIMNLKRYI